MTQTTSPASTARRIDKPFSVKLYRRGRYLGTLRTRTFSGATGAVWMCKRNGKVDRTAIYFNDMERIA